MKKHWKKNLVPWVKVMSSEKKNKKKRKKKMKKMEQWWVKAVGTVVQVLKHSLG